MGILDAKRSELVRGNYLCRCFSCDGHFISQQGNRICDKCSAVEHLLATRRAHQALAARLGKPT